MSMTDPIADMLTRIRNAVRIGRKQVSIPKSKMKVEIARVLEREGFIHGFQTADEGPQGTISVQLKYGPEGENLLQKIERASKPGRRRYARISDLRPVLNGMGIHILSTSKGILSDREARKSKVGGEILCTIW